MSEPRNSRQLPASNWQLPSPDSDADRSCAPGKAVDLAGIAVQSIPAQDMTHIPVFT